MGILAVTVGAAVVSTRVAEALDTPAPTAPTPGAVTRAPGRPEAAPEATVPAELGRARPGVPGGVPVA